VLQSAYPQEQNCRWKRGVGHAATFEGWPFFNCHTGCVQISRTVLCIVCSSFLYPPYQNRIKTRRSVATKCTDKRRDWIARNRNKPAHCIT
jgi:hypothetical protein